MNEVIDLSVLSKQVDDILKSILIENTNYFRFNPDLFDSSKFTNSLKTKSLEVLFQQTEQWINQNEIVLIHAAEKMKAKSYIFILILLIINIFSFCN